MIGLVDSQVVETLWPESGLIEIFQPERRKEAKIAAAALVVVVDTVLHPSLFLDHHL